MRELLFFGQKAQENKAAQPAEAPDMAAHDFLPKDVREGLDAARRATERKRSRLKVRIGDEHYTVLRRWTGGFSLAVEDAPNLRGLVDLYDGGRHLYQCLIIHSDEENGERRFEYKRSTAAVDKAPLDFERDEHAPIALLPDDR